MKITKSQLRQVIIEACGLGYADEHEPLATTLPAPAPEVASMPLDQPLMEIPGVPVPEDYDKVRDFLELTPGINDLTIDGVRQSAGAGCERSTAQGIIDHLKDRLHELG